MGKTDTIICLKKRNKGWKNIKKNITRQKPLNVIMNKNSFLIAILILYNVIFSYTHNNK